MVWFLEELSSKQKETILAETLFKIYHYLGDDEICKNQLYFSNRNKGWQLKQVINVGRSLGRRFLSKYRLHILVETLIFMGNFNL